MPSAFVRVSLQGSLPGGEVWSVNPAFQGDFTGGNLPSAAELQAWATQVATNISTIVPGPLKDLLSARATIDRVRAAGYGEDGRLALYADAPAVLAGQTSLNCPPDTAVCISLYSDTVGRSGRGRLYWPALDLTLDGTTGRISSGSVGEIATSAVSMLEAIEAAGPQQYSPLLAVYSSTTKVTHPITSVRVGDVPDGQRRRKDALTEQRVVKPYPAP